MKNNQEKRRKEARKRIRNKVFPFPLRRVDSNVLSVARLDIHVRRLIVQRMVIKMKLPTSKSAGQLEYAQGLESLDACAKECVGPNDSDRVRE
jgi:hypothetical protein